MTIILAPGYSTTYPPESGMNPCISSSKEQSQWYYTEIDDRDDWRSENERIKRYGTQVFH